MVPGGLVKISFVFIGTWRRLLLPFLLKLFLLAADLSRCKERAERVSMEQQPVVAGAKVSPSLGGLYEGTPSEKVFARFSKHFGR